MARGWFAIAPPMTATLAATIRRLAASMTGDSPTVGTIESELLSSGATLLGTQPYIGNLSAGVRPVVVDMSGDMLPQGDIAIVLKQALFSGVVENNGVLESTVLPGFTSIAGYQYYEGIASSILQRAVANLVGQQPHQGNINAAAKAILASLSGSQTQSGAAAALLRAATATMNGAQSVPEVQFVSVGVGQRSTTVGEQLSWSHTVPEDIVDPCLLVAVVVSNTSGSWSHPYDAYEPPGTGARSDIVSSSINGNLTRLAATGIGNNGQWQGTTRLFAILGLSSGSHTLSTDIVADSAGFGSPISTVRQGNSFLYSGVGGLGIPVEYQPNSSSGGVDTSVPTVEVDNMAFTVLGLASAPAGFNQTQRHSDGGSVGGLGDYMLCGDAEGVGGAISFTTSSTGHKSGVSVELISSA